MNYYEAGNTSCFSAKLSMENGVGEWRWNWSVKQWINEINEIVKKVGLSKWKEGMERKSTLVLYKSKECPKYEKWYDGEFESELLSRTKTTYMEVNERTYRYSESGSKACVSCDSGEDETVEHVVLVCGRYELLSEKMMRAVRLEVEAWAGDADEWTPGEWMRVLLGSGNRVSDVIVKEFLDGVWRVRSVGHG